MEAGNEAAAAILVQTIFLKDGHLQGILGEQATKSPMAAAEFLKPFYRAVLAMIVKARTESALYPNNWKRVRAFAFPCLRPL